MPTNMLKMLFLSITALTLWGCAQTPTHINISSDLPTSEKNIKFNNAQTWQISSQDIRVARHLIEIVEGDNVATLINEQSSLRALIEKQLSAAWHSMQLNTSQASDYQIDIQLVKALATVTESAVSYQVDSSMVIKIKLQHQQQTFIKLFNSTHQWEAPFSVSAANIAEKLNTQLSQLLSNIIQDKELNDKLNQF